MSNYPFGPRTTQPQRWWVKRWACKRRANRRRKPKLAPRFIKAQYAGQCAEKGTPFAKGADILYSNGLAFCENSKTYQDFLSAEIDRIYFGSNA